MARRQMRYTVETYCLNNTNNGQIVRLGSKDKYIFESYGNNSGDELAILYIFRFADGRTINEYHYYELEITELGNCDNSEDIIMQSDDILLGVNQLDGCTHPTLFRFRPYYRRGANQTLASIDPCI